MGKSIATICGTTSVCLQKCQLVCAWELTPAIQVVISLGILYAFFALSFMTMASVCMHFCIPVHTMCAHPHFYGYDYRYVQVYYDVGMISIQARKCNKFDTVFRFSKVSIVKLIICIAVDYASLRMGLLCLLAQIEQT